MNGKAFVPLIAGLGIGGFALWMGVKTLRTMQGAHRPVENVPLWAARDTIPRGTEISEEMVSTLPFPSTLVPQGAITKKEDLVGRVPCVDAPAGLPILDGMLYPPGARSGLHVKAGFRAVAVKIDEGSGVDYHLEPGAFVDVVGSFQMRRNNQQETLARTLVENVEVAAVGPKISSAGGKDDSDKNVKDRTVRAITIFVRPEDVPKLLLAEQKGRIKLSLRGDADGDQRSGDSGTISDSELTGQSPSVASKSAAPDGSSAILDEIKKLFNPPAPTPTPAPTPQPVVVTVPKDTWEVVIYRGEERRAIRFKSRDSRELVAGEENEHGSTLFGNPPRKPATEPTEPSSPVDDGTNPPPDITEPQESQG